MSDMLDFITDAEDRIQKVLLADAFFQNVTVLKNTNGDLAAQIEQALAGLGMFLVVTISGGAVPLLGDIQPWDLEIVLTENPMLNRSSTASGKTARLALQKLIRCLRSAAVCDLTEAREVISPGQIIWQVKGTVPVVVNDADPQD